MPIKCPNSGKCVATSSECYSTAKEEDTGTCIYKQTREGNKYIY